MIPPNRGELPDHNRENCAFKDRYLRSISFLVKIYSKNSFALSIIRKNLTSLIALQQIKQIYTNNENTQGR